MAAYASHPTPTEFAFAAYRLINVFCRIEIPEIEMTGVVLELKKIRNSHDDPNKTGISKKLDNLISGFEYRKKG